MSVQTTKTSTSEKPESEPEQQSGHLPYTFVAVATVCTCMFLVVLVVFSIVRHTTLSKRQRNSSIERAPMRIRIRSHSPRHRTRHHRHHRSSRGHVVMHGAVRQTVSGFFEGNVAPPPYSAVLARVVQTLDSAIHRINRYPADSVIDLRNTYPLDSDLSGG